MRSDAVTRSDAIREAVDAARWAPSVHNTQPWSFAVAGEEISVRADSDRRLRVSDPAGRQMLISGGASLFTLRTMVRCKGYEPEVLVLPDPDRPALLAIVRVGGRVTPDEYVLRLGGEIRVRRTHRAGFTTLPVPGRTIEALVQQAGAEGALLTPVEHPRAIEVLSALTTAAQALQSVDRRFTLELVRWAAPPGSPRGDGVPAGGYPDTPPRTEPAFAQRDYGGAHGWGAPTDQRMSTSPGVVALLTTSGDSRREWVAAGQALQRVLLHASGYGISAAFHTQALELPPMRELLRTELCAGRFPQMIMRLGITFDDGAGTRRALPEVLEVRDQGL
ncbi:Acg family FMN-binding oxidoreductase [Nonomuraea sp. NPDC050663]|uniref:Acg family FMN-binding oxidoreductase n=1 Tax=Nonomuraea sp. NPDC050663 TaxID=3364370 RepID=UPI0037932828